MAIGMKGNLRRKSSKSKKKQKIFLITDGSEIFGVARGSSASKAKKKVPAAYRSGVDAEETSEFE